MFTRKTVLVVGAGGSHEVNLPVREGLKSRIASKLQIEYDLNTRRSGDGTIAELVIRSARNKNLNPNDFFLAGRQIAAAMPQAISIDNFLHTHAANEDLVMMGKLAIAASILEAEQNSNLIVRDRYQTIDFSSYQNIWHNTFCKMLCEGVPLDKIDTVFDNLTIITFNYDRCIEHYVAHWLANYMLIDFGDACRLTSKMKIFHPYGQVGKLPWQDGPAAAVPYGELATIQSLPMIASQIRTFTERVDDDAMLQAMRNALGMADQVVYLGFSFNQMNMNLMRVEASQGLKNVYGTVYGMSGPNVNASRDRIARSLTSPSGGMVNNWFLSGTTANSLLNDHWYQLSE